MMTTLQLDNELDYQMGLIASNYKLKRKVLDYIKSLTAPLNSAKISAAKHDDGLIHIDPTIPLPSDKYVGMITAPREDDDKALEDYLSDKYNLR